MAAIEVKHVSKSFPGRDGMVDAVKDVSLTIEPGDIYGIIGMSGAGKSTLVRCLNYLEKPTKGQVIVEGKDLGTLTEKELLQQRTGMSMIFQHFNLLQQKTVLDNVCFPLRIQKVPKNQAKAKARELLKVVGLEEKEGSYPSQLSGGQQQRVAIARALATDPRILLCDEATSALDPQTTAQILDLLKEINERMGITIVIITHQMSVIRKICSHVAILNHGVLVEEGLVEDVFSHPKTKEAKQLIMGDPEEQQRQEGFVPEAELHEAKKIRIVFSTNSAFEPVISNMILELKTPVNILLADTKNVGGTAKGEMILGLPEGEELQQRIIGYLKDAGLDVEEVTADV